MAVHEFVVSKRVTMWNAASAALCQAVNICVMLWYQHRLLQDLEPEDFGVYPLITIILFVFSLVTSLFVSPCQRFVVFEYAKGNRAGITEVISSLIPFVFAIAVATLIFGTLLTFYIDNVFVLPAGVEGEVRLMVAAVLLSTAFNVVFRPFVVGFFARQKLALFHLINLVGELFRLAMLGYLTINHGARIIWVVLADSTVAIGVTLVLAILSTRLVPEIRFRLSAFSLTKGTELIRYGFQDAGITMARVIQNTAPVWLLNRFATSVDVSNFHLGTSAFRNAQKVWIPVRGVVGPPLIGMEAKGEFERMREWYYDGAKLATWMIMLPCLSLIIFANEIIELYAGATYRAAGFVILFLLMRYPFQLTNSFLPQVVRAKGIPNLLARLNLVVEVVNALILFFVIYVLQASAVGAALTLLATTILSETLILWPLARKLVGIKRKALVVRILLPGMLPAVLAAFAWVLSQQLMEINSWFNLLVALVPGTLVYAAVVIIMAWLQHPDIAHKLVQRIQRRKFA